MNSGITYLRNLVGAETNNVTLSTCRDATYATLASRVDDASALELLSCFFQVTELSVVPSSGLEFSYHHIQFVSFYFNDLVCLLWAVSFPPVASPGPSPSVVGGTAAIPSKSDSPMTSSESNNPYHLTLVPTIGIVVTAVSLTMLVVLVILIRRKNRELDESESLDRKSAKALPSPRPIFKIHQGEKNQSVYFVLVHSLGFTSL